ncbi:MAG TPA: pantetheine-phosphate adenylyltransferase [Planctomycetaceae bacterium]|nr:pantetheine-phosphate adenylyltransferase [Planctomycetaceae bacterium]
MPAEQVPLNRRHAVYAGSFDPLSLGHLDVIRRGGELFDRVTVAIGINPAKSPLFSPQERLAIIRAVVAPLRNVDVACFEGLAVNFVRGIGAGVMLRGLRTLTDIEAEFTMTLANHALDREIETVFLMASEGYSHISSSLVKQVALLGKEGQDESLAKFVPPQVIAALRQKLRAPSVPGS